MCARSAGNEVRSPAEDSNVLTASAAAVDFPVVALGASSGGLRALETFFRNVTPGCGMAFVLAMHLSPEHKSRLAEILQAFTMLPVTQVTTAVDVVPEHVYVISPRHHLTLHGSRLRVSARSGSPTEGVIDHLFLSLANAQRERAVGIVFSGSGADGTSGMKAIKERGGLLFVQDPDEAESDAMPRSIIATGLADFVMSAAEMPARLMEVVAQAPRPVFAAEHQIVPENEQALRNIMSRLRSKTGYDFSHYKRSALHRQLDRRMLIQHVDSLTRYALRLQEDDGEVEALFRNLLVNVTRFFRDPDAFHALGRDVLPKLFQEAASPERESPAAVRVWVPGCATGEEAYSLAMLLAEQQYEIGFRAPIQLIATDIDEAALSAARSGMYSEAAAAGLSDERLERFFQRKNEGYQVTAAIRDMILFAAHDVTRDPPFSRIDLISCRNLLIYFEADMQERVLQRFSYSLRPAGYLFLGTSEGGDRASALFHPITKKFSLFQRKDSADSASHLRFFPVTPLARRLKGSSDFDRTVVDPRPDDESHYANDALILANQNMQSFNEELRSMMEEHEIAEEELQSLNEELTTLNQELQNKIEEHRRLNSDLHNLIQSTRMATLFLDQRLNVLLYTPESTKLFNLLSIDVGRPLEHLTHRLAYGGVLEDARQVLEEGSEIEREVQTQNGSWYIMRIMPYQTTEGQVGGVVLTFADISLQKEMEQVSEHRFNLAFHAGPVAASIISRDDGCFLDVNEIFEQITGYTREEVLRLPAHTFGLPLAAEEDPSSTNWPGDPARSEAETRIRTRSGSIRDVVVSMTPIEFNGRPCYLSLFYDVTERKRLEREILLVSDREQRRIGVDLHDGLGTHLTGIAMMARGLARNLRKGRPVAAEDVDEIARLVSDGIEQARTLAQGLNPFLLEEYGLPVALQSLATNMQTQTGITCSFEEEGDGMTLGLERSLHLFRITQEALTNAARHGQASRIRIILSRNDREYRLTIQDDGAGFEPVNGQSPGMGLHIMRYRAEMIGARLDIASTPGSGTTVTCSFRVAM